MWLHGGGEGGLLTGGYNYYDNESPLRANRGALGFSTNEAQDLFDGAYVVEEIHVDVAGRWTCKRTSHLGSD
ncbi:hypothetical protein [Pseudarthrobacter sp. NPDC057230]|uniref:hypothetical protein n=1 Tax=Pseudarthrobacter sp. NPDC057230 TaxID=3346057 RepID=UPI00362A3208